MLVASHGFIVLYTSAKKLHDIEQRSGVRRVPLHHIPRHTLALLRVPGASYRQHLCHGM